MELVERTYFATQYESALTPDLWYRDDGDHAFKTHHAAREYGRLTYPERQHWRVIRVTVATRTEIIEDCHLGAEWSVEAKR